MKQTLAHASFDDAVLNRTHPDRDVEDTMVTAVNLPQWIRECTAILKTNNHISEGKLYTYMIDHGTAMIEWKYGVRFDELGKAYVKMVDSENVFVNDVAMNYHFDLDGIGHGGRRRTVRVPIWCKNVLGRLSGVGMLNYSSMLRLSICFSLSRNVFLRKDRLQLANTHVSSFDVKFNDCVEFCENLIRK